MNKKFAAVGIGLAVILSLTNCTGEYADAEQLNIETKTIAKPVSKNFPISFLEELTMLEKEQKKALKIEKNTAKMKKVLKYLKLLPF